MTLRLRLTLFYALLVALVLAASGAGLYVLLARNLNAALDAGLAEAAELLSGYVENEGGRLVLREVDEPIPELRADLAAVLYDPGGRRRDSLGRVPEHLKLGSAGFSTWAAWRVYTRPVSGGTLLTLRARAGVEESLTQFLTSLLTLAPFATLVAFGLGYVLVGRALLPLARLTDAAFDLARRRAWRERLPIPGRRDELWRLAQGTNELLGALAGVIERERRFTADAAHELRTPLTVLRGRLEKALEQAPDDGTAGSLNKAVAASDALLELAEKLLALARTDAGQGFEAVPVALDEVAFESAERLRPLFRHKGLALRLALPTTPTWVKGDRVALTMAVSNLLENALKFTPAGDVMVRVEAEGCFAKLSVQDSGPGVPEVALPHIFERFYQVEARDRQSGAGLGLALVASAATLHGGEVWVESYIGQGACFVLRLPLSKAIEAASST